MKNKYFKKLRIKKSLKIWMIFRTWKMFQMLLFQIFQRITICKSKNRNLGNKISTSSCTIPRTSRTFLNWMKWWRIFTTMKIIAWTLLSKHTIKILWRIWQISIITQTYRSQLPLRGTQKISKAHYAWTIYNKSIWKIKVDRNSLTTLPMGNLKDSVSLILQTKALFSLTIS